MFHKIKAVSPLENYMLIVSFVDGSAKIYDMNELISTNENYKDLKNVVGLFTQATVDVGGYGVSWNDDIDIACDELWENGKEIETSFTGLLAFSDATALWGLNESTLRKAISYGKLKDGIDVMKFGKQWIITSEAMEREYGSRIGM